MSRRHFVLRHRDPAVVRAVLATRASAPSRARPAADGGGAATGGTIAGAAASDVEKGYTSGQLGVEQLINAVPQAKKLAVLKGEQISNIGSQDMSDEVWLKLANRVNELGAMADVEGIVITHGTDTIEETAYFLNLVAKNGQADRPDRLHAAGHGAFGRRSAELLQRGGRGRERGGRRTRVLVVLNDWIHGAASLTKTSTTAVQTFMSPLSGLVGTVSYGKVEFNRSPVAKHTSESEFSLSGVTALPRVDIIMAYENMDGALIDAAVGRGRQGPGDCGRRQRQPHPGGRCRPGRPGEEGHRLRARVTRGRRPRRSQRRAGRRQARVRGVDGQEPAEGARSAAACPAQAAHRGRRAADLQRGSDVGFRLWPSGGGSATIDGFRACGTDTPSVPVVQRPRTWPFQG